MQEKEYDTLHDALLDCLERESDKQHLHFQGEEMDKVKEASPLAKARILASMFLALTQED